ncbi:baseplate multidomain protein megatron [Roseinatronobacter ekhonensis]|uniref:baseplate multidomain protein megatron n=1 Tax=Roseinatronobacter ekhonensis TaxID=254356 RepID=UPI0015FFD96B|nr:glycoside hydrolase TIM-barrel-like domain-containing protein [Roseibaca ekhonensis]
MQQSPADWSEYFGYITDQGDRFFHLDPLWADANIDAVAIDNYMPLSDWRDGTEHADAGWGSIYNLDYLTANVAGGEGYDWFYASALDRDQQRRTPIRDESVWQEDWIWRYKDIRGWWENDHHDRVGGVRLDKTAWEPRSKPIWFTEYGCAAIDRGTNQPNVFLDPKSSESRAPYFSRGWRDDTVQMQYVRAVNRYWSDPAHNPQSEFYQGPMVDLTRAHLWAWDARPYPWFPGNATLWSDGANWARGHWVTGRATAQPLDAVIAEICARAGLTPVDVSRVYGVVRGMAVPSTDSPRAMLQALMLAFGIDAVERDGTLRFVTRDGRAVARLGADNLVRADGGDLTRIRAPQADDAGRVRLGYVAEGGDFDLRTAEAVFPDASSARAAGSDLPLVLPEGEARLIAERWLTEARVVRDSARFALPPSSGVGAGDVVELDTGAGASVWRIDRTTLSGPREMEATRVEPGVYGHGETDLGGSQAAGYTAPGPVQPVFLDLPLIPGTEVAHAPWLAVSARAWPGAVALHRREGSDQFVLNTLVAQRAFIGVTATPLVAAPAGRWDNGPALRVRMMRGVLQSASPQDVLGGANRLAIGLGEDWEVFQFAEAEMVAPDTYALRRRLRGQQGTDGIMPLDWPAGALVVVLDGRLARIDLPRDALGGERAYRIGPASRPIDDASQRDFVATAQGVGLRPYRPAHLRLHALAGGDLAAAWVRRTREGGDAWGSAEVPVAEAYERYMLRVRLGGEVLREEVLDNPAFIYTAAMQATDGAGAAFAVEVAQVSDVVGPGPFARAEVLL